MDPLRAKLCRDSVAQICTASRAAIEMREGALAWLTPASRRSMYYSDEVGALVFDFGSAYTKVSIPASLRPQRVPDCALSLQVGHAGEGAPKVYLPTPIGSCVSELPEADMKAAVAASAKADAEEMQQRVAQNAYELRSRDKSRRVLVGEGAQYFRENMEISYPVENGLVSDWEGVEKIFECAMTRLLHVDVSVPRVRALPPPRALIPSWAARCRSPKSIRS